MLSVVDVLYMCDCSVVFGDSQQLQLRGSTELARTASCIQQKLLLLFTEKETHAQSFFVKLLNRSISSELGRYPEVKLCGVVVVVLLTSRMPSCHPTNSIEALKDRD